MIINLHGKLADAMGRETWDLKVKSVSEALRAIEANTGKLFHYLIDGHGKNIGYEVIVDGEACENPQELQMEGRIKEIDIIPQIQTAEGIGKIIAGIILIVIAWYAIPYLLSAGSLAGAGAGSSLVAAGTAQSITSLVVGGYISGALASIGAALILGGLYESVVGAPESTSLELDESKGSFIFSGPVNQTRQGNPVPVAYGEIICGSQVVDISITNENYRGTSTVDGNPSSYSDQGAIELYNLNINQWGYTASDGTIFTVSQDARSVKSYNVIDPNVEILE